VQDVFRHCVHLLVLARDDSDAAVAADATARLDRLVQRLLATEASSKVWVAAFYTAGVLTS